MRLAQAMTTLARKTYWQAIADAGDPGEIAIVACATTDAHGMALLEGHDILASPIEVPGPEFQGGAMPPARAIAISRAAAIAALDAGASHFADSRSVLDLLASRRAGHVPLLVLSDGDVLGMQLSVSAAAPST
jgi:hypothetical protein